VNLSYQYVPNYTVGSDNNSMARFGLGVSVNLGNVLSTPSRISQTEDEIKIAEADYKINQQFLRAETIRRYSNYKRSVDMLKIRNQAVNDSESSMLLVKHRFENGETTLEEYNKALRTYTDNQERKTESEGDVLSHKASLEEIIGVKIGEIL
jgi:outer membrane protein TolC